MAAVKYLSLDGLNYFYGKCKAKFVAQESGKGLSTNDFTDELLTKLNGIEAEANKYVLPIATSAALGGVKLPASNPTITIDANTGEISLTKTNLQNLFGYDIERVATASVEGVGGNNGMMSAADKEKLDGVAAGAQVNVIETVKVDNVALTITDKAVNIDLSDYAKKSDIATAYSYKGTVSTYADLPASPAVGDVYNIETADATNGIHAGDNVAWNGTAWDNLAGFIDTSVFALAADIQTVSNAEIDSIFAETYGA